MGYPRFCFECRRAVRDGTVTICPNCGDALLDLASEVDREIVDQAISNDPRARRRAFLLSCGLVVALLAAVVSVEATAMKSKAFTMLVVVGLAVGPAMALRIERRRIGLRAEELLDESEARARRVDRHEFLTSAALVVAVVCIAIHVARRLDPRIDAFSETLVLTVGRVRHGVLDHRLLTHGLLHADAAHLVGNVVGLLVLGVPIEKRVGRRAAVVLLVAGILAGGIFHALLSHGGDESSLVGISGGVYAWLAAPLVLDPFLETRIPIGYAVIPAPTWLGVLLLTIGVAIVQSMTETRVAIFAHLGAAFVGIVVAVPMRGIRPRASYARHRAREELLAARDS